MSSRNVAGSGDRIPVQVGQIVDPDDNDQTGHNQASDRTGRSRNIAAGNARVGQQVDGDIHGDITISFRR